MTHPPITHDEECPIRPDGSITALTADGPMADFMLELQYEIWDAAWQTHGKGFGQIVPDGIARLRQLLPRGWNRDTQTVYLDRGFVATAARGDAYTARHKCGQPTP